MKSVCVCVYVCVCVWTRLYRSALCFYVHVYIRLCVCVLVCMCWNTSISHPTSNQWCQPFDACSTVTKPYCTHTTVLHKSQRDREKLHCFSLTSDTFSLQFLAHKMLSSFVPCSLYSGPKVDILWYSKRYIDIYMYSIYNDDTLHIFVAFYVVDRIVYMWLFSFGSSSVISS